VPPRDDVREQFSSERWTGDSEIDWRLWMLKGLGVSEEGAEHGKNQIVVSVIDPIGSPRRRGDFPTAPGASLSFTEDVVLKQYNRKRPGRGLPKKDEDRYAGIHSGTVTLLRIAGPGIASTSLTTLAPLLSNTWLPTSPMTCAGLL
jgi:hypothetical protein